MGALAVWPLPVRVGFVFAFLVFYLGLWSEWLNECRAVLVISGAFGKRSVDLLFVLYGYEGMYIYGVRDGG